jgi:hypothetical protein
MSNDLYMAAHLLQSKTQVQSNSKPVPAPVPVPPGYTLIPIPNQYLEKTSPYHREIFPGVFIDAYKVLDTFRVTCPALQHAIKKALAPGQRGHKDLGKDLKEIAWSADKAVKLQQERDLMRGGPHDQD